MPTILKQTRNKNMCKTIRHLLAAITPQETCSYVSISLVHLATGNFAHSSRPIWMRSAGMQQSLSHSTDSQLDLGPGFD